MKLFTRTVFTLLLAATQPVMRADDGWYSGGGYQPWTFGYTGRSTSGRRSLGNLYDTGVDFRVNRKLTLSAYLGYTRARRDGTDLSPRQGREVRISVALPALLKLLRQRYDRDHASTSFAAACPFSTCVACVPAFSPARTSSETPRAPGPAGTVRTRSAHRSAVRRSRHSPASRR
jgi:hypothetical protein